MKLTRRGFFKALAGAIAAPAIVKIDNIMKVSQPILLPEPLWVPSGRPLITPDIIAEEALLQLEMNILSDGKSIIGPRERQRLRGFMNPNARVEWAH